MQYVTEYGVTNISDTRPRKNMITIGTVDTSDLMMIKTWAINIPFQSPELKWFSWTHTTPYILMTKVIESTSSMLDTPQQDKLYRRLPAFNAYEHSCIMMIMGGSKMSKTEYDLKAMCILPMTYPKTVQYKGWITISSNPDYHPIMQADTCVSSKIWKKYLNVAARWFVIKTLAIRLALCRFSAVNIKMFAKCTDTLHNIEPGKSRLFVPGVHNNS